MNLENIKSTKEFAFFNKRNHFTPFDADAHIASTVTGSYLADHIQRREVGS